MATGWAGCHSVSKSGAGRLLLLVPGTCARWSSVGKAVKMDGQANAGLIWSVLQSVAVGDELRHATFSCDWRSDVRPLRKGRGSPLYARPWEPLTVAI